MTTCHMRFVVAAFLITISLWLFYDLSSHDPKEITSHKSEQINDDGPDEAFFQWSLKPHGLQNINSTAKVTTLYLQAVPSQKQDFELIEEIDVELPAFTLLEEQNDEQAVAFEVRSLDFTALLPRANASSIIFGVATTLERLEDSLDAFAYWAAGTGTTIVALVSPEIASSDFPSSHTEARSSASTVSQLLSKAHSLDLNLVIHESPAEYITRYVTLLFLLHEQAATTPAARWASIIDDDTFFLSTDRLLHMLYQYNATEPHYVGGLTEDLNAVEKWGYLAYGGAGIFLSVPLLAQLQPHLETCLAFDIVSGDGKLGECIYKYTTTKLSVEKGLNQLDLFGDHTGFYEAVRPLPISVHHWKSWGQYDMLKTSAVASITGQNSVLQKFHLGDGWWMTHGFSIVKYSDEDVRGSSDQTRIGARFLAHREGAMEHTFTADGITTQKSFLHSLEPLRPRDEGKTQYMIESAVEENMTTMSLYYVRRVDGIGQNVIRVVWTVAGHDIEQ